MTPEREQMEWPPDVAAVLEALEVLTERRADMSSFQAAVLEALMDAGSSMAVHEIIEKLSSNYDQPPTRAAVLQAYADRESRRTSGEPSDS
jgi:hypothetical protein